MGWYGDLKIRNKLFTGYAVVLALSCLIGYYGLKGMHELKARLDDTHDNLINSIVVVSDADHHAQQHKREVLRYLFATDPAKLPAVMAKIKREEAQIQDSFKNLDALPLLAKVRSMSSSVQRTWAIYLEAVYGTFADVEKGANP